MNDIAKIDKNFEVKESFDDNDKLDLYAIPNDKTSLYGIFYEEERFVRLPKEVAYQNSRALIGLYKKTAGGRLRFSTNSKTIKIIAKWDSRNYLLPMPLTGVCGFSMQEDFEDGSNRFVCTFVPPSNSDNGYESEYTFTESKERNFTIYFPLYNNLTDFTLAIDKGATLGKGIPYKNIKPILYYGSSITQGGCASRPDNSYEAIITKWNNIDHINLGMSGGCRAEEPIVNYLSTLDASIFVCDYDHNSPSVEHLKETHYKLYETYRKANPDTPILFLTRPNYYTTILMNDSDADAEGKRKVVKATYNNAKKLGDNKVYFLDGRKLFGKDYNHCVADGTHPNDIGFYFMAKAINKMLEKIIEENKLI